MPAKNLRFQKFGRLTVLEPSSKRSAKCIVWKCRCDCGKIVEVRSSLLLNGNTSSCGCLKRELLLKRQITHGLSYSSEYQVWSDMIQRCDNPKKSGYQWYGGRGIKVCEKWHKFENFYKDMGKRPLGKSIDRYPDNDGNYESKNCRWATPKEQAANRRDNKTQHWFLAFNFNTGIFEEDNSQCGFASRHGLSSGSINACLKGKSHQTKGWEFDYLPSSHKPKNRSNHEHRR